MTDQHEALPLPALPVFLYRALAADGSVLYIGITQSVGVRIGQHARSKPWWHEVAEVTVESHPTLELAAAAERDAICAESPRYNITHSDRNEPQPRDRSLERDNLRCDNPAAYRVDARWEGEIWLVHVPKVGRSTQARRIAEIEPMARDLIAVMLEVAPDSFEVDIVLSLPERIQERLDAAKRHRAEAAEYTRLQAQHMRLAAKKLVEIMPMRDAATILGISHQRVHQLVNS